jgi:uncharacterized protein (TIGR02246 family)
MTSKTTTAGSDADRQAVLDVLAHRYRAWEAGDAETFAAGYAEDASVIQPGVYEKDREEIRTNMAAAFAGPLSGSPVAARPVNVRFLTGDTAIVVSENGIILPGQDAVAGERLAHRLLPQQPRQLGRRLPGAGHLLSGEPPCARIQTGSRAVAAVVAVVIAQVNRYGMVG